MKRKKEEIVKLAEIALSKSEFKNCKEAIINNSMGIVQIYSEDNLELAKDEVLKSVYQQNCDMAIFAHYRASADFDNAVTEYREENDKRS